MRILSIIIVGLITACGGSGHDVAAAVGGSNAAEVRDSGTVQLVLHTRNALVGAPRLVLDDAVITEIRGDDPASPLTTLVRPVLLEDGRIAMMIDHSLVIFGQDGTIAEQIGRAGAGPKEFGVASLVRGLDDTLLVNDTGNRRVAFVVPGRGVIRTRPLRVFPHEDGFSVIGQFGSDALLLASNSVRMRGGGEPLREMPWYAARADAGRDSVVMVVSLHGWALVEHEGSPTPLLYGGRPFVAAVGPDFVTIDGNRWTIDLRRADGALFRSIRIPESPRLVDADAVAREADGMVAFYRQNWTEISHPGSPLPDLELMRKNFLRAPRADTMAAIQDLRVGADGVIWVKDGGYTFADSTWVWTAVTPAGEILGRLSGRMPDMIVGFGKGSVLMQSEDADGFAIFRLHRFTPVPGPSVP